MALALLSDIHGNLPALEAVEADLRRRGVDEVVTLGDALSGPLLPLETARHLAATGWVHLAGNHERQLLTLGPGTWGPSDAFAHAQLGEAELAWLASLKPTRAHTREVFLCHGSPRSDVEYLLETVEPTGLRAATAAEVEARLGGVRAAVVACGHTHLPRAVRARGSLVVNPGSVGLPAYLDEHPFRHAVETGSPDARYAVIERTPAGWRAELVSVPYDHASMAALASRRGRDDWARALATGHVA